MDPYLQTEQVRNYIFFPTTVEVIFCNKKTTTETVSVKGIWAYHSSHAAKQWYIQTALP
jgi:hypothetical protein